jgi:hypothetical protein
MRQAEKAFARTIAELWTRLGLRPSSGPTTDAVRVMVDGIDLSLSDKGKYLLIEAGVGQVSADEAVRAVQLKSALKVNLGLLLSCEASLCLADREGKISLVSRASYRYSVNSISRLIAAIEDAVNLVEFYKRVSSESGLPARKTVRGSSASSFVFVP